VLLLLWEVAATREEFVGTGVTLLTLRVGRGEECNIKGFTVWGLPVNRCGGTHCGGNTCCIGLKVRRYASAVMSVSGVFISVLSSVVAGMLTVYLSWGL
jgi:hypothetical protein